MSEEQVTVTLADVLPWLFAAVIGTVAFIGKWLFAKVDNSVTAQATLAARLTAVEKTCATCEGNRLATRVIGLEAKHDRLDDVVEKIDKLTASHHELREQVGVMAATFKWLQDSGIFNMGHTPPGGTRVP